MSSAFLGVLCVQLIPFGWLWSSCLWLRLCHAVNYLGGEMPTATLNFSGNGFQIAVQYYNFLRLGFDGYERVMRHTLDNAIALRKLLVESGYFKIMNESQRIPVVAVNAG